jgi:subtilase family serine protease
VRDSNPKKTPARSSSKPVQKLAITLPLRNQSELNDLLIRLSDRASPDYRKYLSVAEFTERFGPTETDYQAVVDFA